MEPNYNEFGQEQIIALAEPMDRFGQNNVVNNGSNSLLSEFVVVFTTTLKLYSMQLYSLLTIPFKISIGNGKMMVLLFSALISLSVWR